MNDELIKNDQPNETAASPTNHVVPVRTPDNGIKPMAGAVTSVPATDAKRLREIACKLRKWYPYGVGWLKDEAKQLEKIAESIEKNSR